jgi:uncharacterized protein (TIGR03083 family)
MSERTIAVRYAEAVESFVVFARTLGDADWATPVPCTPLWTARDVLSHVAGVPDDGLAGRLDGAATDPWTASQVERNAHHSVDELLARLLEQHERFGSALDHIGEVRPPFDCHSHEHDLRQALGRPGNRDSAVIDDAATLMITFLDAPVGVAVNFDDGTDVSGGAADAGRTVSLATTKFEVFRSQLGRRSAAQVRALDWSGGDADIDAVVAGWFTFGPSDTHIVE